MTYWAEGGWWMPDGETHLTAWMQRAHVRLDGRLCYQRHKYLLAMEHVPADRRGLALDLGAHVGLWSWQMASDFEFVIGYEPVQEHALCWYRNLWNRANAICVPVALGHESREVVMHTGTDGSSGDTWPVFPAIPENRHDFVPMRRLDDGPPLPGSAVVRSRSVDLVKVDMEGFEYFALQGAEQTIRRDRPVVIVEQKPGMAAKFGLKETAAVQLLESWGAQLVAEKQGDYVLTWA